MYTVLTSTFSHFVSSNVEIVQPPTITEAPKLPQPDINVVGTIREQVGANVFVIIGERFELTCNITQPVLPEVMYSWFKDGRAVNGSAENEQIFVMDNTTRGAFGLYCCKAVNIGGLSQACSRVVPLESGPILRTQPSSPSPRLPEQVTIAQTTVSIGGSLWTSDRGFGVITCEVILSNPPISSIEWFVGDPPVMIDENTAGVLFDRINITTDLGAMISHLVIRPTLSGDRANFTCLATSPAGTDRATSEYGGVCVCVCACVRVCVFMCMLLCVCVYMCNYNISLCFYTLKCYANARTYIHMYMHLFIRQLCMCFNRAFTCSFSFM